MGKYVVAIGPNAVDEYYRCDHWPMMGEKVFMEYMTSKAGGMIPNAASIIAGYGVKTYVLDTLGDDNYTSFILDDLKKHDIDTSFIETKLDMPNTRTHIILAEDERTIFIVKNKKPKLKIDDEKQSLLKNAEYIYTTINDIKNLENPEAVISNLKEDKVRIAYDVETESFVDARTDRVFFENANVLFFNENGFRKYCGDQDSSEVIANLLNTRVEVVAITLGSKGCIVYSHGVQFRAHGIEVDIKDTTGAGDTFNATFIYGLIQGWELSKIAQMANAAAARSIMFLGPKAGKTSIQEIQKFLENRSGKK